MERLTTTETEMLLRWFLYHADRATLDLARTELPVYFHKAWNEYVVKELERWPGNKWLKETQ